MPKNTTTYDVLISCPGDVSEYLSVINECVESFNKSIGNLNKIRIETKHWYKDSYPQSGGKPQELLNNQLVRDCDAAIAIFWTRFGTPTDKYDSGTEEEIEEMLSLNKQVFMYFLEAPIIPSVINPEQYKKIQDFKEDYQQRGLYTIVNDKDDFRIQLTNHLTSYFLKQITINDTTDNSVKPILTIRDINTLSEDKVSLVNFQILESRLIKEIKDKIIDNISTLNDSILPVKKDEEPNLQESDFVERNITYKVLNPEKDSEVIEKGSILGRENVIINENEKDTVNSFAHDNGIKLHDDFWNIGNLKTIKSSFNSIFTNNGPSYVGSDAEKDRYLLLDDLYRSISYYNQYVEYIGFIDNIGILKLMVSNLGNTFDEDIDVKVIIPKGCLLKHNELPYPGIDIIQDILNSDLFEVVFKIHETDIFDKYEFDNPNLPSFNQINRPLPFLEKSRDEKYEDNKEDYNDSLDTIFQYRIFEKSNSDILVFKIKYLKHNSSISFPSVLMLKDVPESIEYEISSKCTPDVIKGSLVIETESNEG